MLSIVRRYGTRDMHIFGSVARADAGDLRRRHIFPIAGGRLPECGMFPFTIISRSIGTSSTMWTLATFRCSGRRSRLSWTYYRPSR